VNKAVVIGAIIIVIIGIVIVSATTSMDFSVEDEGSVSEEVAIEEVVEAEITIEEEIAIEEVVEEEIAIEVVEEPVVDEGRDLTVELTESINLSTP